MNKKMIALGVAVAMAAAVGCGATDTSAVKTVEASEEYRFDEVEHHWIMGHTNGFEIVDTETGVEYLLVYGKTGGPTITPLLNPDGTPKIAEGYEMEVVE